MALLPYQQIGDNLYADQAGKYFNINKGYRNYVQSPLDTQTQKLNSIYDAQKKSQLDQLRAQQTKAVNDLNVQKKNLAPVYQQQRNAADVTNAQNVSRLRELMAANGINASGENVTAQANLGAARQTALNDINTQENQAVTDLNHQIANVNDPTQTQAIINQIETAKAQSQLDAWNQYMQQIDNKAADWRDYMALHAKSSGGSSSGGGGSKGRSSKSSSSKKASSPDALSQAYAEYQKQQAIQEKYAPRPFSPTQTKPRPIY